MELSKYLNEELVMLDLASRDKDGAIEELTAALCRLKKLSDPDYIMRTVHLREEDRSTGIGNGVAIPHARIDATREVYLALGISRDGVEWGSTDEKPVHFVFLVVGPHRASDDYLRVLADISRLMTRAAVREDLLAAKDSSQILRIIEGSKNRGHR